MRVIKEMQKEKTKEGRSYPNDALDHIVTNTSWYASHFRNTLRTSLAGNFEPGGGGGGCRHSFGLCCLFLVIILETKSMIFAQCPLSWNYIFGNPYLV